jgi:hypothetical protein
MAKQIEISFPFKGLDESNAFARQRGGQSAYTTASCLNVIGFDPTTGRNRGAARGGTGKYCPDRIDGSSAGQCLAHVTGAPEIANRVTGASSSPASELRLTAGGVARDLGPNTPLPVGDRTLTIVGVAGGDAAAISTSGVTAITNGTAAFSTVPKVIFAEPFFNDIYFCDGANYKYFDVSANLMAPWEATEGTMPAQESEVGTIIGATNASPIVVTITAHGYETDDQALIAGVLGNTAANGNWTITVLTADTFSLTGSTGNGAYTSGGTCVIRRIGSRCSLIAVWGGRIVLSGLGTDPNNIFMSAVGDPFDWDYAPDVQTVQQAVAGNVTSGYGKNIDIVTALIPYTDDILIIGGSHSIRKFLGNPAEGGINASVTDITGIAPGAAWCQSPEGVIYFFGSRGGVYKIEPEGGVPSRITALTIDERLADINLDTSIVTLLWDDRAIAVRVYITPTDGSETTHYVWDVRNEAWWPFAYLNDLRNPLAIHLLSGGSAAQRSILEYGQDGYVRKVDVDAVSDDGEPIESYVYLGPFSQMMLTEIDATLSEHSNNVTWSVCSSSSLEKALEIKPRVSGRFKSGRNPSQWPRTFIEEGYLRLSATGAWAMERLRAGMDQVNETTRRVMRTNR